MTCNCGTEQIPGGIGRERAVYSWQLLKNGKLHTHDACDPWVEPNASPVRIMEEHNDDCFGTEREES